jgi:hypothetical protein
MLKRSKDRKVANLASPNGKVASIANAFGLPAGKAFSCPNATSVCERVCYAGKLEKIYKGVKDVLLNNFNTLLACGDDVEAITALLSHMVSEFESECEKKGAPKRFRIHWDGDFYSDSYAQAWRETISMYPDITFWVYTRVPSAVEILTGLDNLSLYFSTDADNRLMAVRLRKAHGVKLAWLDMTFEEGKQALQETVGVRAPRCPENNRALSLITAKGGACNTCGLCVEGRADVLFSVSKK